MAKLRLQNLGLGKSSTTLTLFFGALLFTAALLLGIEIIALARGEMVDPVFSKTVLGLILFVCICLFMVSFYVVKRINMIASTATRIIDTSDLSQRIPVDAHWDDISKLSTLLNTMLTEIEQLVKGVRTLSDNIAHDLRHPLTRLRNHIETMRKTADGKLHADLTQLMGECDALLTTFQALLRISNIESGKRHADFQEVDLTRLIADVVELYEPLAADKAIALRCQACPLTVTGNKDLLFQAFANLVDNAIKYTPKTGQIDIALSNGGDQSRVVIRDSGQGVSDEHKESVFRRFYRVEGSRSAHGSGLGLSLVAAIIKLHKGLIQLHDNKPSGLIVTVTL